MTKLNDFSISSFWNMIKESLKDHLGKASSTRINGYWMSILFTICVLCCVSIEIYSAIIATGTYTVSNQLIAICVLILGQQALLFNLKRKSEDTSFPTVEKLNNIVNTNNSGTPINIPDVLPSNVNINKVQENNINQAENNGEEK